MRSVRKVLPITSTVDVVFPTWVALLTIHLGRRSWGTTVTNLIFDSARLGAAAVLAGIIAVAGITMAPPASADSLTICPSGLSGVTTDDTSCAFADNVRFAWYYQPGTIVTAYSPVTHQSYTMQCTPTATTFWPEAKRCVGVNSYGVGLIVYID